MAIRAVVLDIGGILEISPEGREPAEHWTRMVSAWEERLGRRPGELLAWMDGIREAGATGRCTYEAWRAGLARAGGMDEMQLAAFVSEVWDTYLGVPNHEMFDWLRAQRPRFSTALLSNSFVGAREEEEKRYRYSELVEHIVYSHEVGIEKPDRRIYEITCERLGVAAREVLFLDDVLANVEAARAVGMQAVHFRDTKSAITELNALLDV